MVGEAGYWMSVCVGTGVAVRLCYPLRRVVFLHHFNVRGRLIVKYAGNYLPVTSEDV